MAVRHVKGRRWVIWFALALVALVVSALVLGRGAAPDDPSRPPLPEVQMGLWVDEGQTRTLEDILHLDPAEFSTLEGYSINLGFARKAAWLRLALHSPQDQTVLISLTPNFVDEVDVYVAPDRPGLGRADFSHSAMGDHRPLIADGLSGLANIVPVSLRADETTLVYVRAAAINSSLGVTVSVYSPLDHTFRTTLSALAYGLWFGGMAILIVIQLAFFHYDRKSYFAWLAFSSFIAMLVYTGTLGLSRLFLFAQGGIGNDLFTAVTAWFGITASALAAISILELPKTAPWLNRMFIAMAGIGLVGVGFALAGANMLFANIASATALVLITLGAFQAVRTAGSDGRSSRLRATAFGVVLLGVMATVAQRTGIWTLPEWVTHGYGVSIIIHTILLTASLGIRLQRAEAMNHAMRQEALAAARLAEQRAHALVEDRTRELRHAKSVAESALQAELASQAQQVRFMEVISHQYRTPLAAIRTHIDNIGLSLPREDEPNRHRLERVRRGIARLVEVLEINLSRARLSGPAFRPELVAISPAAVVASASARARDLLQNRIETVIPPAAETARILADSAMLELAIINLLENAAKFSRPGHDAPVYLCCGLHGAQVIISVQDQGIGIPAADRDRVLDPSVRGSNTKGIEGTGAGLSLVSRITAAHGGRVEIESTEGEGTTVRIILPAMPE